MSAPNILRPEIVASIFIERELSQTFSALNREHFDRFEVEQMKARLTEVIKRARIDGARLGGTKRIQDVFNALA